MCVSARRPAELTASSMSGKTTGAMMFAGWRTRAHDRASRQQVDLVGSRHHAGSIARPPTGCSSPSSSAPSSERPVLARKTSSSDGWCSWSCAIATLLAVESAHDPGEVCLARLQPDRNAAHRRNRLTEAGEDRSRTIALRRVCGNDLDGRSGDLRLQRVRRALGDDPPVVDDPDAVGEHVGLLEVLRGQEDGHALVLGQPPHLLPQRGPALDVEPGGRLVEEEDARAVDEREREVEPALHPARVAADLAIGRVVEADAVEQLVRTRPALRARQRLEARLQPQVLAAGEQRIERGLLQRSPDRLAHLRPLLDDVEAADARRPRTSAAAASASISTVVDLPAPFGPRKP